MKKVFSVLLLNFFLAGYIFAETPIEAGFVYGTWIADNSPYEINGEITIPNDSTLIIEPGVTVKFKGHYALQVQGRLIAVGTEADSILFTVADTNGFNRADTTLGGWFGIRFIDTPVSNDSSKLAYCRMEYGKAVANFWHLNAGGAFCAINFGKIEIAHCLFIHNLAGGSEEELPTGGAIHLAWSDIIVKESILSHNRAIAGGAVQYHESNPTFINTIFTNNAARDAGAISDAGNCISAYNNCQFLNNSSKGPGGAVSFGYHSYSELDNTTFSGNSALSGAGILASYSELQITNATFENNTVTNIGGGLSLDSCQVVINNCTFRNNNGDVWAGGIHSYSSDLKVTDCYFENNSAEELSGGIHSDFTRLTVKNTTFSGNSADISGGIHSWFTDLTVKNCTFKENTAVSSGAGIHGDYSHIAIDSSTFTANQADWGAGVQVYNCDLQIDSCLFSQNKAINGNGGAIDYLADSTIFDALYKLDLIRSQFIGNTSTGITAGARIEQTNSDTSLVNVLVDQCTFSNNHSDVYCPFRMAGNFSNFQVANSVFSQNTTQRYVAGPGFISGTKGTVYNCIFASNYAVYTDSSANSSCASLGTGAEVDFFNCTFVDTSDAEGYGLSVRNGSRATLTNTIIWGCGTRPLNVFSNSEEECEAIISYCNIENGMDSLYVTDSVSTINWGNGNLAFDPRFFDWQNNNFHLQDDSPLIGAGVNCLTINDAEYCAPNQDIEGTVRPSPQGSNPDIGAYENNLGEPLAITDLKPQLPKIFKLDQNYPNPFNPITMINYQLPMISDVKLTVFNLLGQKVVTLINKIQPAGKYQVEWDASGFASGIYYYQINAGDFQSVKKMVFIK